MGSTYIDESSTVCRLWRRLAATITLFIERRVDHKNDDDDDDDDDVNNE